MPNPNQAEERASGKPLARLIVESGGPIGDATQLYRFLHKSQKSAVTHAVGDSPGPNRPQPANRRAIESKIHANSLFQRQNGFVCPVFHAARTASPHAQKCTIMHKNAQLSEIAKRTQ